MFCEFKNLTADGIKDLLYSWRLKAGVLYLLPEGIISKHACSVWVGSFIMLLLFFTNGLLVKIIKALLF